MAFSRKTIAISTPTGSGEVAYLDFGDPARPVDVVFSHGNGFNAMTHRQALEPLGDRLRIIAVDQRGHGRTTLPADPEGRRDWHDLVDDLGAVIAALGVEHRIALAGHSMGGTVSTLTAARLGDRVKALALFDPVIPERMLDADEPDPERLIAYAEGSRRRRARFASRGAAFEGYRGRGVFKTWPDAVLADFVEDGVKDADGGVVLSCDPAWEASNYLAQRHPAKQTLLSVGVPTQVLAAPPNESTCRISPDAPEVAANPNLSLRIVEGTTHLLPVERPDLVWAALLQAAGA